MELHNLIIRIEALEKQLAEKENEMQLLKDDLEAIRAAIESALEEEKPQAPHGSAAEDIPVVETPEKEIVQIEDTPEEIPAAVEQVFNEEKPLSHEQQHEAIMRTIEEFSKELISVGPAKKATESSQTLGERAGMTRLSDLKKAFGINERFLFANELFGGDMEAFTRAIEELNHLESLSDAERLLDENLASKYKWNDENESVIAFKLTISRRFS